MSYPPHGQDSFLVKAVMTVAVCALFAGLITPAFADVRTGNGVFPVFGFFLIVFLLGAIFA